MTSRAPTRPPTGSSGTRSPRPAEPAPPPDPALTAGLLARATLHAGGHRSGERGCLFASAVISGLRRPGELVQEEISALVLTAQRFDSADESVELANCRPYARPGSCATAT
ncbi:aldehyde dehydrogenase family protein [Streptomyces sp. NPDC090499]|uniref:aldehyde dehydrogenase family protein n=1 Tax=Streptomyces sp. NPDC090499 TaxID=3365965 RepID=UPI003822F178